MYSKHEPKGLYLEEYEIGKQYVSEDRIVTESDAVEFARLSGDYSYVPGYAPDTLGFIMSTGLTNLLGTAEGTTVAFMECSIKYLAPLKIGSRVRVIVTPTETRHSSKPGRGILKQNLKLVDQDDVVIMESDQVLMKKARE